MKTLSKTGYLVLRGTLSKEGNVLIRPVDFIPPLRYPKYTGEIIEQIEIRGVSSTGKGIFAQHPFKLRVAEKHPGEIRPDTFALAVPADDELDRVEIFVNSKLHVTIDRKIRPEVTITYKIISKKKGLKLNLTGSWDRVTVIAQAEDISDYCHLFSLDSPTDEGSEQLIIPWNHFPAADRLTIRVVAIRGISLVHHPPIMIKIPIQPPELAIYCLGTRLVDDKVELSFCAKGRQHGQHLMSSEFHWDINGQEFKGQYVTIRQTPEPKLNIIVTVKGIDGKSTSAQMEVEPSELLKAEK